MEQAERKKKTYRNFTRSEKAIIRAYVDLMRKNGRGRITVTDIVTTADLNRSTFYAHFKSSEDVREKIHTDVINQIIGFLDKVDYNNSLSEPAVALKQLFSFIESDEELYKNLLNTDGAYKFLKRLEDTVINNYLLDDVVLPQIKDREEFEMNLRFFIGGVISVIQDWAAGSVKLPLDKTIEFMGETIKARVRYYMNKE